MSQCDCGHSLDEIGEGGHAQWQHGQPTVPQQIFRHSPGRVGEEDGQAGPSVPGGGVVSHLCRRVAFGAPLMKIGMREEVGCARSCPQSASPHRSCRGDLGAAVGCIGAFAGVAIVIPAPFLVMGRAMLGWHSLYRVAGAGVMSAMVIIASESCYRMGEPNT